MTRAGSVRSDTTQDGVRVLRRILDLEIMGVRMTTVADGIETRLAVLVGADCVMEGEVVIASPGFKTVPQNRRSGDIVYDTILRGVTPLALPPPA
jgi:hypothetical protein